MKKFQQLCAAFILMLSLSFSAFAGEILLPGVTAPGEMHTPGATADPVMEIALGMLLNVSSLF